MTTQDRPIAADMTAPMDFTGELAYAGEQQVARGLAAVGNAVVRASLLTVALACVDLVCVLAAGLVIGLPLKWLALATAVTMVTRAAARLYRRRLRLSYFDDVPRAVAAVAAAFGIVSAAAVLLDTEGVGITGLAKMGLLFLVIAMLPRALVFQLARWARQRGRGDRTMIVGSSGVGADLARKMKEHPEFGLHPVGFVDPAGNAAPDLPVPLLGTDLAREIAASRIGTVVMAFTSIQDSRTVDAVMTAQRLGCTVFIVPRMFELFHDAPDVERLRSYPLIRLTADPTSRPTWWLKRMFDVAVAGLALAVLSPVILACAVAVLVESGRPIFFRQVRIGLDGREFEIYKLRSLRPATETEASTTWTVAGDPRIGPVGRLLRRTSLDELPQLWNIVRGDMSLVGPRPERPGFVQQFSAAHERYWARHRVPSGLTGLAQISGLRGDTSIADRAKFDNYYIANWSLWLDVKIMLLTVREVLRRGQH
jgi:exopolysaccharide biosynthesis polyprenyl glycosylphosphotransferase